MTPDHVETRAGSRNVSPPEPEPRTAGASSPHLNAHPRVVAAHRRGSLLMALPGVLGVLWAPFHVAWLGITGVDVGLFVLMYWLTQGIGLSVGFHRHFSHGAFRASKAVRGLLAVLGSMGAQGALTYWVSIHRRHHALSDREGDPHSPRPPEGAGAWASWRAFWHGYYGWSLCTGLPSAAHYCPDLLRVPWLMRVSRRYRTWVVVGLLVPAVLGGLLTGSWEGALGGLQWGGLFRLFVSLQMTGVLNAVGHRFGSQPYDTGDLSRNNGWWAIPLMGELWHNNHHAYPTSAAHGFRWWQLDLNWLAIRALERLGLARDVKRPPAAAFESRSEGAAAPGRRRP